METLLAQHRKERKQLQAQCVHLKKQGQVDKKKKNELLVEIQRLEVELQEKQRNERLAFEENQEKINEDIDVTLNQQWNENMTVINTKPETHSIDTVNPMMPLKKFSRQKLRKLRKEKEIEEIQKKALEEPQLDFCSQEMDQFLELLSLFKLKIHPIPANGHWLKSNFLFPFPISTLSLSHKIS
ncbi:hypothetical protein HMI54_008472 [Coelomomyces lativittatus]|nr:hypothetical protein HMI54_008472 [Coelomomyces lativittatus]